MSTSSGSKVTAGMPGRKAMPMPPARSAAADGRRKRRAINSSARIATSRTRTNLNVSVDDMMTPASGGTTRSVTSIDEEDYPLRMDRIEAMKVFVAALDEGSLAGAGRRLRRSPAAVSRAIAFLENHVGAELLHRTTRSLKLSEAGERYVVACRRVLVELEEADLVAGSERSAPRGTLTLTAPIITGEDILRSILEPFMNEYQAVSARLVLLDRTVNLIDEGIDV